MSQNLFAIGLLVLAALWLGAFVWQRGGTHRRKQNGLAPANTYSKATRLGNALHQLQSIVNPEHFHVIQEQLRDEEDAEEEETRDPRKHILRQAARLRRGVQTGPLTALLPARRRRG